MISFCTLPMLISSRSRSVMCRDVKLLLHVIASRQIADPDPLNPAYRLLPVVVSPAVDTLKFYTF